ncbi:MAG TPA: hypothetical protein VK541_05010 [Pedobacter sp.]|uniref:hypothetical protein n=1 Tax=Pedobacter sp. TaxID=1411316 RepID=UPI002C8A2CDB|nr:hypothetical protein [Pedobacter sp.]HMI01819.1 hypothetical protein [Pedobacter sp.]
MSEVTINQDALLKLYKGSDKKYQKQLESAYGKEVFQTTGRPATFQEALDFKGETLEAFNKRCEHDTDPQRADKEAEVVAFAYNKGKVAEIDGKTWFYFPWMKFDPSSGFRFSYGDWANAYSRTDVGSRLLFLKSEDAEHAGKHFTEIYARRLG